MGLAGSQLVARPALRHDLQRKASRMELGGAPSATGDHSFLCPAANPPGVRGVRPRHVHGFGARRVQRRSEHPVTQPIRIPRRDILFDLSAPYANWSLEYLAGESIVRGALGKTVMIAIILMLAVLSFTSFELPAKRLLTRELNKSLAKLLT